MRSSCQTRALTPRCERAGCPANATSCRMAGGKRPVSRPADERGVKAEFGYDSRKGVGACDRGPSGLGEDDVFTQTAKQTPCKTPQTQDVAHEMCRLPKSSSPDMTLDYLQSRTKSFPPFLVPFSRPGTQCHTSTTSLRKQISKLRESNP